jgi:hypothetical protein
VKVELKVITLDEGTVRRVEAMGSKEKFWVHEPVATLGWQRRALCKLSAPWDGAHWSEHVASTWMRALGVDAHWTCLCRFDGRWGVLCHEFLDVRTEEFWHGIDLMMECDPHEFSREAKYPAGYRVPWVLEQLEERLDEQAADRLAGQLLVDAWLRNSDRHSENWGYLRNLRTGAKTLTQAYDNAACLGRDLGTERMAQQLRSGHVGNFVQKGLAALVNEHGRRARHNDVVAGLGTDRLQRFAGLIDRMVAWDPATDGQLGEVLAAAGHTPEQVQVRLDWTVAFLQASCEDLGWR